MRKRTSDYYSSDTEQMAGYEAGAGVGMMMLEEDIFLLRPGQSGDHTGDYQEAKQAYDNGTDEVRQLLLHECNLIYECKMCRNMFRSLAQFIGHKRTYCCGAVGDRSKDNGSSGENCSRINDKNLIVRSQNCNLTKTMPKDAHGDGDFKSKSDNECSQKDDVVTNAQSAAILQLDGSTDLVEEVKTEWAQNIIAMDAVQHEPDTTVVKSSEQNIVNDKERKELSGHGHRRAAGHILCKICKGVFQTDKQLRQHVQKKHLSYVFQCPACTLTFMQPAEVIRHLSNEHKKPVHRTMRDSILKTRIKSGDADEQQQQQKIVNNRELKRLQSSPDVVGSMGAGGIGSDGLAPKKIMSSCLYCDKSFERRAALSTHLLHCRVKQAALEKNSVPMANGPSMGKRIKLQTHAANSVTNNTANIKLEKCSSDTDPDTELNEMFANLGKQTFGVGLRTVSLDQLDLTEAPEEDPKSTNETNEVIGVDAEIRSDDEPAASAQLSPAEVENVESPSVTETATAPLSEMKVEAVVKLEEGSTSAAEGKKARRRFRIVHAEKRLSCRCKICNKQFNALSNLRRHISMFHYRAQRFGCILCDYRAFRRYDIVNHLGYVHKMKGEREAMSIDYVSVHEVNYSKDDVESDIVLLNDEPDEVNTAVAQQSHIKTYEKRVKRRKMISGGGVEGGVSIAGKITRQKLKRSLSQVENGSGKGLQRRPIRNRIKPVNKDFVYDLPNLLKKEDGIEENELVHPLKRRNTLYNGDASTYDEKPNEPLLAPSHLDDARGAAQRLALSLVGQGLAASATQPELPAERPQMRPRLISTNRVDMQPVPVIEASELEAARLKTTLLDDTFLEKVSKRSTPVFKIKPCLALRHSKLSWLLEKVDSSLHNNGTKKLENEALTNGDGNQVSPPPSIPRASSPPPTPRKRITLLERLSENKAKYRESLLRSALEN